jgi:hypothetical protein
VQSNTGLVIEDAAAGTGQWDWGGLGLETELSAKGENEKKKHLFAKLNCKQPTKLSVFPEMRLCFSRVSKGR